MTMHIRRLTEADAPFMERMMLLAGFPPDRPLLPDARSMQHAYREHFLSQPSVD